MLDIQATIECGFTLKRVRDKITQSNGLYRFVLTTQLNHLVSLTKWLSARLRAKWLWVRPRLLSLKLEILVPSSSKEFLDIQATIECRFTLKRVRDMIIVYSQLSHVA